MVGDNTTAIDGHTPSIGWSPTIKNMVTNLPEDGHPFSKGWSPTLPKMVPHPPKIWTHTIPRMVTNQQ